MNTGPPQPPWTPDNSDREFGAFLLTLVGYGFGVGWACGALFTLLWTR